jgi:hypothetical protein
MPGARRDFPEVQNFDIAEGRSAMDSAARPNPLY